MIKVRHEIFKLMRLRNIETLFPAYNDSRFSGYFYAVPRKYENTSGLDYPVPVTLSVHPVELIDRPGVYFVGRGLDSKLIARGFTSHYDDYDDTQTESWEIDCEFFEWLTFEQIYPARYWIVEVASNRITGRHIREANSRFQGLKGSDQIMRLDIRVDPLDCAKVLSCL